MIIHHCRHLLVDFMPPHLPKRAQSRTAALEYQQKRLIAGSIPCMLLSSRLPVTIGAGIVVIYMGGQG